MNLRRLLLVLAAALIAIETLPAQTQSDSEREIAAIREQWVSNWNAQKLEPILKLYAQDAVFLPSTGQRIEGRQAIGNYLKQLMDSRAVNLSVNSVVADDSGKLAFDSGNFQYTLKGGGTTIAGSAKIAGPTTIMGGRSREVKGSYLIVLKRGTDGKWLIQQHASAEVPPAANQEVSRTLIDKWDSVLCKRGVVLAARTQRGLSERTTTPLVCPSYLYYVRYEINLNSTSARTSA
jgi:uncharacterized protein (TIGR02246 family)